MSTPIQDEQQSDLNQLITYSVTDAAIAEMSAQFMPLKVFGIDDAEGYARCKEARNTVRSKRVEVEKRRVELKKEALEFGRLVDGEAKRITAKLTEVEQHLVGQLAIIDDEKKRREEEAARAAKDRLDKRIAALQAVHAQFSIDAVSALSDEAYEEFLDDATTRFNAAERLRKEQEAELERLRAAEAEREAKLKAQEEETRRLQAELLAKQQAELREKEQAVAAARAAEQEALRKAQAEREAREREAKAAEEAKQEAARKAKSEAEEAERLRALHARQAELAAEMEAARKIADEKLFEEIKTAFPTLELAWVEIARLRKLTEITSAIRKEAA